MLVQPQARSRATTLVLVALPTLLTFVIVLHQPFDPSAPRAPGLDRAEASHRSASPCLQRSSTRDGKQDATDCDDEEAEASTQYFALPAHIKKLHIDIGPNTTPLLPPDDEPETGMLAVEPNIAIAHMLREKYQKRSHATRFFTLCVAVAGAPLSGGVASFRQYNTKGVSSSLASVSRGGGKTPDFAAPERSSGARNAYAAGTDHNIDFVPVVSLARLLRAVPPHVDIPLLKTDAQGFDLAIVRSAPVSLLRRADRLQTEVYVGDARRVPYAGVGNNLTDWLVYMRDAGYALENRAPAGGVGVWWEWNAIWVRQKLPQK